MSKSAKEAWMAVGYAVATMLFISVAVIAVLGIQAWLHPSPLVWGGVFIVLALAVVWLVIYAESRDS